MQKSQEEPGIILYVVTKHPSEAHTYVALERYRNMGALKTHNETPHLGEAMSKIPNWVAKPPQVVQLSQVAPK